MGDFEKTLLIRVLDITGGNMTKACKMLSLTYRQIRYKVEKFNLDVHCQ